MSKSLDFCQTVAGDISRSSYGDRDWESATELFETEAIFDNLILHGARHFNIEGISGREKVNVKLLFNCDAEFDYFTSESIIHDGTFAHIIEAMRRCVQKVCYCQTHYKGREPVSRDNIEYTVGNFVILNEYDGDFVPPDKQWMRERTTVLLPIKYRVFEKSKTCK